MSAFSSFYNDSVFVLNSPATLNDIFALSEEPNIDFPHFHVPESFQNLDQSTNVSGLSNNEALVLSVPNKNTMDSSSTVTDYKYDPSSEIVPQKVTPMDKKKRKLKQGPSANSAQSKDTRQVRRKKQQKMKGGEVKKATNEEAPSPRGYVYVRARRGQATNCHSLAERARREKISKRMKLLEALVPGCDKLTGKARVLDEIIYYVQSLQNQVEFLSMKISSVNQRFSDFGMELDEFTVSPEQQTNSPMTANNYFLLDNSANSTMFQSSQIPNPLPLGNRQVLWEEEDQRML